MRARVAPLTERRIPTVLLGLLVALATWDTSFSYPTTGLDTSWGGGLYFAVQDNLSFGPDIAWTYGPLGFLNFAVSWDTGMTSLSFIFLAGLHIALSIGVVWSLRRSFGALLATVVGFLVLALLSFIEVAFPVAALLCFAALARDRPRYSVEALIVVGATFGVVLTLVKLSIGPPVMALCFLALIGARARPWQLALYLGLVVVEFIGLWLLLGESLGNLVDFAQNGRQIISGYSEAMIASNATPTEHALALTAAIGTALVFAAGSAFASYRDDRARLFGVAVAALVGFSVFKEGVVRMDVPHLSLYFSTIATLWLTLPWSRDSRRVLVGGLVVLSAVALPATLNKRPAQAWDDIDAPAAIERAYGQIEALLSPQERSDITEFARYGLQQRYAVDDTLLQELSGHSVSVEPAEIGAVFAYDLDWAPLPVIQGYSAYTSELDALNADEIESPSGPERILRGVTPPLPGEEPAFTIDGRFAGWDPPEQTLATLCNFAPLATAGTWQVLGRITDRCGEPEAIGSIESSYGETVDVPEPGPDEVVFVRIRGAEVSGLESLRALLYRAEFRYATVNGTTAYRLVPGTSGDGLILRGAPRITGEGLFAQSPQAETLALTGPSGDLRYDFFSMEVDPASGGIKGRK